MLTAKARTAIEHDELSLYILRSRETNASVPTTPVSAIRRSHPPSSAGPSAPGPNPKIHIVHDAVNMIFTTCTHLKPRMYKLTSTSSGASCDAPPCTKPVNSFSTGMELYRTLIASTFCQERSSVERSLAEFGTRA